MLWTVVLMVTGVGGILCAGSKKLSVRRAGWVTYTLNEILWFLYALHISSLPLALMAGVWFAAGVRNIWIAEQEHRKTTRIRLKRAVARERFSRPWTGDRVST